MVLPSFRYHPDPVASGSIEPSAVTCRACNQSRGYIYTGPVYTEADVESALCPWCIADGTAHRQFDVTFVDDTAFRDPLAPPILAEVTERTPGYAAWQSEEWPVCCADAAAFLAPVGIAQVRTSELYEWEGVLMTYIVQQMHISGGAANRLLESLHRDRGPTAYLFRCLHCHAPHVHIDYH